MALLTTQKRKAYFQRLGLGEYNKENIKKLQKRYMERKSDVDGEYGKNTDNLLRTLWYVKKYAPNFTANEFKCECGGRYCSGFPTYMKPAELVHIQKIRDHWKRSMIVTCGMRCKGYNRSLNGSIQNSLHLRGFAVDFYMAGVTDSLAARKNAIKWIKKQPRHHYSYGNGINSNGYYVSAPYMGNALHTDTQGKLPKKSSTTNSAAATVKPEKKSIIDKEISACKEQAKWMKNYTYKWQDDPTVAKSKKKGTCVTYVACVLQRIGVLKSGQCIWHNGNGYGTGKVYGTNSKMSVTYMGNKSFKACRNRLKRGDIILVDDNKSGRKGNGGHIMVFSGKWSSKGNPYVYDNGSANRVRKGKSALHTYSQNRKILARVRLKESSK